MEIKLVGGYRLVVSVSIGDTTLEGTQLVAERELLRSDLVQRNHRVCHGKDEVDVVLRHLLCDQSERWVILQGSETDVVFKRCKMPIAKMSLMKPTPNTLTAHSPWWWTCCTCSQSSGGISRRWAARSRPGDRPRPRGS